MLNVVSRLSGMRAFDLPSLWTGLMKMQLEINSEMNVKQFSVATVLKVFSCMVYYYKVILLFARSNK